MKKRLFQVTVIMLVMTVLFLLSDYLFCMIRCRQFVKDVPEGTIVATTDKYILRIVPETLLRAELANSKYPKEVLLRVAGTRFGKYNQQSNISANNEPGLFCEVNRYYPVWTSPLLPWRDRKEREVKEIFLILTVKEIDTSKEYVIQVNPHKGNIRLMDNLESP